MDVGAAGGRGDGRRVVQLGRLEQRHVHGRRGEESEAEPAIVARARRAGGRRGDSWIVAASVAALVVLLATLTSFNLPVEGAAILLGIDQIMDMGRTGVNVMGNCLATVVVARWEGTFDDGQMREFAKQRAE